MTAEKMSSSLMTVFLTAPAEMCIRDSLLGVGCTLITGLVGYLVYKLLRMDHPEVGGAIGTTAGNAAATPASVAAVDATLLAVSEAATDQITAAIIVTAICCPILVSWLHKLEDKRRAAK